jgi:hypothetical protein
LLPDISWLGTLVMGKRNFPTFDRSTGAVHCERDVPEEVNVMMLVKYDWDWILVVFWSTNCYRLFVDSYADWCFDCRPTIDFTIDLIIFPEIYFFTPLFWRIEISRINSVFEIRNYLNGLLWTFMGNHRQPWIIMEYHGAPWTIMDYHGPSWTITYHRGQSWTIMYHQGPPWIIIY